ncbi:hypothetical protein DXG01_004368 [Tephrocybe rancida]|nr:hypothetical protein DXG01_004368 [Tephrocybe rancida]
MCKSSITVDHSVKSQATLTLALSIADEVYVLHKPGKVAHNQIWFLENVNTLSPPRIDNPPDSTEPDSNQQPQPHPEPIPNGTLLRDPENDSGQYRIRSSVHDLYDLLWHGEIIPPVSWIVPMVLSANMMGWKDMDTKYLLVSRNARTTDEMWKIEPVP